jgi:hypothetical protein
MRRATPPALPQPCGRRGRDPAGASVAEVFTRMRARARRG